MIFLSQSDSIAPFRTKVFVLKVMCTGVFLLGYAPSACRAHRIQERASDPETRVLCDCKQPETVV